MNTNGRQRKTRGWTIAALTLAATLPACDSLLDVADPDIIEPSQLRTLQGASALYNGAIGEFALAKDGAAGGPGSALGLVQAMGWFSDEFKFGGTPPLTRAMDLREMDPQNASWDQMYQNLHVARVAAEDAAALLQEVSGNPGGDPRIGELYAVSAAVHILMGEAYCGAVPFGRTEPEIEYGTPLSTDQIMDRAMERLNMADQFSGGSGRIANFASVLRGRALVNQGNYAAAAAAVATVPTDFLYETVHSTNSVPRRELHVRGQLGTGSILRVGERGRQRAGLRHGRGSTGPHGIRRRLTVRFGDSDVPVSQTHQPRRAGGDRERQRGAHDRGRGAVERRRRDRMDCDDQRGSRVRWDSIRWPTRATRMPAWT